MSMRGELISKEYQSMVFVRDDRGGEYVCYAKDLKDKDHVSEIEKENCLNTSPVSYTHLTLPTTGHECSYRGGGVGE